MYCIAPVPQDLLGKRVNEVLLGLQRIFLGRITAIGTVNEAIGQFCAARQLSAHPIVVSYWVGEKDWV
jgi:hypothetical protein